MLAVMGSRAFWMVYTILNLFIALSSAALQQPLQSSIDGTPKRVAIIGMPNEHQ